MLKLLLKKEHGIELKSASSTIEEVVARSFVERVARKREKGLALPDRRLRSQRAPPLVGAVASRKHGQESRAGKAREAPVLGSAAPSQEHQATGPSGPSRRDCSGRRGVGI